MKFYLWLFLFLCVISTKSIAQNHLIPETGPSGELDEYDIVLHNIFTEGFTFDVKLRMMVRPSFGKEYMVGLKSDSTGYRLFSIIPDSSVWHSSWETVPCSQPHQTTSISRKDGTKTCKIRHFTNASPKNTRVKHITIDSLKAELLRDLWGEMLAESRYPSQALLGFDGVSYYFSGYVSGPGNISAYIRSPAKNTKPSKLVEIGTYMYLATVVDSTKLKSQLIDSIYIKSENLMQEILGSGKDMPKRNSANRVLSGCLSDQVLLNKTEYCWQAQLDKDQFPEFITANKSGTHYEYALLDFFTDREFRSIPILPAASLYTRYSNKSEDSAESKYEYFILDPWDIGDINTHSYTNNIEVFGFKKFSINNVELKSSLKLKSNAVLLVFEGIYNRFAYKTNLEVEGEHNWFTLDNLFEK